MTKNRRGKTRSKTQRGGVWYNPLTWFESENDSPYGQSSSNSGFFSSAMNNVDNMATGLTNSVTNFGTSVAKKVSEPFSSSPDNTNMSTNTNYTQYQSQQPYNSSGGKHRRKRRHSKTKKGGKGGLGLTYYATPVSGANVAQPTTLQFYENGPNQYSISGGSKRRKSRKSCKTRRRHKKH
jgi:hypothetical protein